MNLVGYRSLEFNAIENGFTVFETLVQNRMAYPISNEDKAGELILPDPGKDYVFKVEAKLSVRWLDASDNPKIHVDDVGITFGSDIAKACIDERWFYQKWSDNLYYYMGYNITSRLLGCQ